MTTESTTVDRIPYKKWSSPHSQQNGPKCDLKNDRIISVCFQGKPFNITVIQVYAPASNAEEDEVERFSKDLQDLLELTVKKKTGKFSLGVQNEAGQRLIEFCQENALVTANTLFQQHKGCLYHGHHQMVNTEIRLIIFFVAEHGDALHSQQKQDRELTVAQIMNSLLPNSDH